MKKIILAHHHKPTGHIGIAFGLNFSFTILEFIGGFWTNSVSILSDAVHDLGDSLVLGLSWYFERYSHKKRDDRYSYGYGRLSILSAILNIFILVVGSIWVLSAAIPRLFSAQVTYAPGMILMAVIGICANALAAWYMEKGHSHNEKLISLHLMEDLLGWIAVLIGSIIIYFTGWYIIDPILSICISLFVMYNLFKQSGSVLRIILEGTPNHLKAEDLREKFNDLVSPMMIHDLHVWSIDDDQHILTLTIASADNIALSQAAVIKKKIRALARAESIHHATVEFCLADDHPETCSFEDQVVHTCDHH